jgi:hypothetical protein
MEHKFKNLFLLLGIAAFFVANATATQYWVSFTSTHDDTPGPTPGGPKYLLKIDDIGNVIVAATKVVPNGNGFVSPPYGATAIESRGNFIDMWIPTNGGNFRHSVFRAVINKRTLELVSLRKLKVKTADAYHLQVTQKKDNNFLVVQESLDPPLQITQWYSGFPLGPNGTVSGPSFRLYPEGAGCITTGSTCPLGISSDGKILFFINLKSGSAGISEQGFIIQKLNSSGHPLRQPIVIVKSVIPSDVSNRLVGNLRFALYQAHKNNPALFIQVFKADTLETVGDPIRVATHTYSELQTAAIEPSGHFVIYGTGGNLVFQALDALGHPSGQPINIITGKFGSGLDLVKD